MLPPPPVPYDLDAYEAVELRETSKWATIAGWIAVDVTLAVLVVWAFVHEVAMVLLVAALLLSVIVGGLESRI